MAELDNPENEDIWQNEFPGIAPPFGGLSIAVERCPLCERTKRPFTCQNCVEKGDFVHSVNSGNGKGSERFSDKLNRLQQLRKQRLDVFERVSVKLKRTVAIEAKKWEILMRKDGLQLTEKALEESKKNLQADKSSRHSLSSEIKDGQARVRMQQHKLERIQKYLEQSSIKLQNYQFDLTDRESKLCELRRKNVDQLTTFIFSINEIHTGDNKAAEPEESEEEEVVAALAEARRTAYVQGRWIETDNNQDMQYSLVHPTAVCIPANGDYAAYSVWVAAHERVLEGAESHLDLANPGKMISGALCYAAQLVSLLTFYLGVVLPKKCPYSVFCGEELSSQEFYKAVDKLNTNVLYLCFSQNVEPDCLHPHYTVRNLLALLSPRTTQLGRNGPIDVHADLLLSVPRTFRSSLASESESTSESQSHLIEADSDTSGDLEWENVPESQVSTLPCNPTTATSPLPESVASFQQDSSGEGDGSQSSLTGTTVETSTSTTGGLMSSAAASVVSFWRAATSQR